MRHESLLNLFFLIGLVWRGPSLESWIIFLVSAMSFDALVSAFFYATITETAERGLCLFIGLTAGLILMYIFSASTGRTPKNTMTPVLIVLLSMVLGDMFLPAGVEGGLLTLGMAGTFMTISMMMGGTWGPDLIFICSGVLFTIPILNLVLLDTGDVAGWDGSRGFDWLVSGSCSSPDHTVTDLVGLAETAIVAASILIGGLPSLPVIFITWLTPQDLRQMKSPSSVGQTLLSATQLDELIHGDITRMAEETMINPARYDYVFGGGASFSAGGHHRPSNVVTQTFSTKPRLVTTKTKPQTSVSGNK